MSIQYQGSHSITFIDGKIVYGNYTVNSFFLSWYDLGLLPLKRPSIATPKPRLRMINIPGSRTGLDVTDITPGGLTFSRRTGSWDFLVDTERYSDWSSAKKTIQQVINGKNLYCVLEDDPEIAYYGRFKVERWNNGSDYPTVTISYDLKYETFENSFVYDKNVLLGIECVINPSHPTFRVGDSRNIIKNYSVTTAYYVGGGTEVVELNNIEGYFANSGINQLTVYYRGKSTVVSVYVEDLELLSISAAYDEQYKIFVGDQKSLVLQHLVVTATYDNGSTKIVNPNPLEGTFDSSGTKTVTVTYQNKNTTVRITVYERLINRLEIFSEMNPVVGTFYVGDSKDLVRSRITVTAYYDDGTSEIVDPDPISGVFDNSDVSSDPVNFPITYGGLTETVLIYVYVNDIVSTTVEYDESHKVYVGDSHDSIIPYSTIKLYYRNEFVETVPKEEILTYNPAQPYDRGRMFEYVGSTFGSVAFWRASNSTFLSNSSGFYINAPELDWIDLNNSIMDGSYRTRYHVGDLFRITLLEEPISNNYFFVYRSYAQIVGIDEDLDKFGNVIPITWITQNISADTFPIMNEFKEYSGGYTKSDLRLFLLKKVTPKILPDILRNMLVPAQKTCRQVYPTAEDLVICDKIWIPSYREIFGEDANSERSGPIYDSLFYDSDQRIKGAYWRLRTESEYFPSNQIHAFYGVTSLGDYHSGHDTTLRSIALGFCTGLAKVGENPSWVFNQFKEFAETFELEGDIYDHVVEDSNLSFENVSYPAVVFSLISENSQTYTYRVLICNDSNDNSFANAYANQFNLTFEIARRHGYIYIYYYLMTTNKRTTE